MKSCYCVFFFSFFIHSMFSFSIVLQVFDFTVCILLRSNMHMLCTAYSSVFSLVYFRCSTVSISFPALYFQCTIPYIVYPVLYIYFFLSYSLHYIIKTGILYYTLCTTLPILHNLYCIHLHHTLTYSINVQYMTAYKFTSIFHVLQRNNNILHLTI